MKIQYSDKSVKDLKKFSHPDRTLIVEKIMCLSENFDLLKRSKKVTELKGGKYENQFRFVIARKIRILFRLEEASIILLVLRVGIRKNIY